MKRTCGILVAFFGALAAAVVVRALTLPSKQMQSPAAPHIAVATDAVLARLSRAVRFRTISAQTAGRELPEHDAFIAWLSAAYPRVHSTFERELVGGRSVLYTWKGSDALLAPLLLMGHYDVVPVDSSQPWTHPPFSGAISGGYVWGRGTLDDKITVIGLLEAAEALLAAGFTPKRTILFAFGHDEEVGGTEGAAMIAKLLESRGAKLEAVIDEGGAVTKAFCPACPATLRSLPLPRRALSASN